MQERWTHRQATRERQTIDAMAAEAEEKARQATDLHREIDSREARLEKLKPEGWGE